MTVNAFSRARRFLGVVFFTCTVVFGLQMSGAYADHSDGEGVRLEGQMAYRFSRVGRGPWDVTASVTRVVNYDYSDRGGLKGLLILSRKGYRPGTTLKGRTVAQTPLGLLEARTSYRGVSFSGRSKVQKGKYTVVFAIVDENNYIEHALNFPKKAAFKTQSRAFGRSSRSRGGEHVEDLTNAQK